MADPETLAAQVADKPLPPVERWHPPLSGNMDLRITRDGAWFHEGRPILRDSLVRLFSTILRRDDDGAYYLVTPVEKWRITVDDAPFVAILLEITGYEEHQTLWFTTNVGDRVAAGPEHPLHVEYPAPSGEPAPYVHVRGRLRALIARAVFVELAELVQEREVEGKRYLGVWSGGLFFPLAAAEE